MLMITWSLIVTKISSNEQLAQNRVYIMNLKASHGDGVNRGMQSGILMLVTSKSFLLYGCW